MYLSYGDNSEQTLTMLIIVLTTFPISAHFNPSAPTEVLADASGRGIDAVLAEIQSGACLPVLAAISRHPNAITPSLNEECLALVWAVAKFLPILCNYRSSRTMLAVFAKRSYRETWPLGIMIARVYGHNRVQIWTSTPGCWLLVSQSSESPGIR